MGVSDQLRDDERPLILAGDYNATWDHAYFRRVLRDATDATVAAGAWTTRTWPTHLHIPCVIAIDHVLLKRLSASKVTSRRFRRRPPRTGRNNHSPVARDVFERGSRRSCLHGNWAPPGFGSPDAALGIRS